MNVFDLIDPSFSYRLIATLMHFLWQGCLVALLAVLGDWLLSRAAASWRYALHVAALAIMVGCVAVTFSRIESPVSAPTRHSRIPRPQLKPSIRESWPSPSVPSAPLTVSRSLPPTSSPATPCSARSP